MVEHIQREKEVPVIGYGTFVAVWVALLILLAVTIAVARIHLSRFSVLINLLIASVKAGLVVTFFMHLKYEGRLLKGLLLLAIATLTAIIALTFSDVWYR